MIRDLRDWKKKAARKNRNKHQWGWFVNPDAGDVEYSVDFFNRVVGSSGTSGGESSGEGLGESLDTAQGLDILVDFLSNYDQAFEDFKFYFKPKYNKYGEVISDGLDEEEVFAWLKMHKQLYKDFLSYISNHVTGADGGDTSVLSGSVSEGGMGESFDMKDKVTLYYDDIEVHGYYGPIDWETGIPEKEYDMTIDWEYKVDRDDIFVDLQELVAEENLKLSDEEVEELVSSQFDELVYKYNQQLLDKYRDYAEDDAYYNFNYDEWDFGIDEAVNIRDALNKIDCKTCGKYDLLNMYDCSNMPAEKKAKLAEMLKENVSADKLYEYMNEESPWQIGLELFADNGHEYKVISVIDEREVDGYELSIVGAIGNELSNADEEVYFVLLDSDIEWGPVDTAEEAIEWASDVRDGYYSDDEDEDEDDIDFIDLYGAHGEYDDGTVEESLDEDTIKQGKHWVNKGKAGTHGKFATKKKADAQRKAMFANGYKESIKEACRRGNAMNEGAMKEIDLEVQEAGGVDAYIDSLESQLRNISMEMRFLRGQARREMKAGGAHDSVDEINDALKATEREYNEVRKKYDYISSQQTGGVN